MNDLQKAKTVVKFIRVLKEIPESEFDDDQYSLIQAAECEMINYGFKPPYSIHERLEHLCNFMEEQIKKEEV